MSDPNQPDQPYPSQAGQGQPWPSPPAQPGWGAQPPPPGYGGYFVPAPTTHPQATTVLTLGLVGLVGGLMCYLPLLLSPVAWVKGARVKREIEADPMRWSGQDQVTAGYVTGIIGTVILGLAVTALVVLIVVIAVSESA